MKRALFIDRDGTIIKEPADEQIDSIEKFSFVYGALTNLALLRERGDFEFVMVSNQDGLGTDANPMEKFNTFQRLLLDTLESVGVTFDDILIDPTWPEDHQPTRKPGIGMMGKYVTGAYDLSECYMIGDRNTDEEFAKNLGCKCLLVSEKQSWKQIAELILAGERKAEIHRQTKETDVYVQLDLNGSGKCDIKTGLGFFDHMLEQIGRHGNIDLTVHCNGDLYVDEHHTIEDTGLVLGECLLKALGDKRGIERYGFCLPMDDCLCQVSLDFGGRPWLVWDAEFKREKIGEMPTEMFFHFFKSVSDSAKMNLNIYAKGENEHHKIEGIFKAFARAIKMAVARDMNHFVLPTSKGVL
ncbi:MAG: bifunctional histidinol-phosphatase/imidazoleglycerol-phosphate dehydratase HisB [Bacteroidaceae bacterium]|jgi:imidazoleglycerol-phosphate dehydratase/histidinol-phosphatase|nr:bifunctional histidinol-phosphatase/imidazoleglycerol-phosphate dehydratase HisB [Bacteroidaceae bacterium]